MAVVELLGQRGELGVAGGRLQDDRPDRRQAFLQPADDPGEQLNLSAEVRLGRDLLGTLPLQSRDRLVRARQGRVICLAD